MKRPVYEELIKQGVNYDEAFEIILKYLAFLESEIERLKK